MRVAGRDRALCQAGLLWRLARGKRLERRIDLRDIEFVENGIEKWKYAGWIIASILHFTGNKFQRKGGYETTEHLRKRNQDREQDQEAITFEVTPEELIEHRPLHIIE